MKTTSKVNQCIFKLIVFLYYITVQVIHLTSLHLRNPFRRRFLPFKMLDNWLKASTTGLHSSVLKRWSVSCGMLVLRCRSPPVCWTLAFALFAVIDWPLTSVSHELSACDWTRLRLVVGADVLWVEAPCDPRHTPS